MDDIIDIDFNSLKLEEYARRLRRWVAPAAIVFAVLVLLLTGFYKVDASEQALVLRFGKYVRKVGPGLHFKAPFGIEKAIKVKVARVFKEEFGYRTKTASAKTQYSRNDYSGESLMLTGDLNIADVEWIVQFRIENPEYWAFNVRFPRDTLRDVSEAVMRRVVGDRSVNEVLTVGRSEIEEVVQKEMQEIFDEYKTGFRIVTVKLQDVNPPNPVKPSFNEVNEAKQDKEKYINEAWGEYNDKVPAAKGQAQKIIAEAEGYAIDRVNSAEGDAQRFINIHEEYLKAREVTRKRMYLETMSRILPEFEEIYIVDRNQTSLLPLLDLNKSRRERGSR